MIGAEEFEESSIVFLPIHNPYNMPVLFRLQEIQIEVQRTEEGK